MVQPELAYFPIANRFGNCDQQFQDTQSPRPLPGSKGKHCPKKRMGDEVDENCKQPAACDSCNGVPVEYRIGCHTGGFDAKCYCQGRKMDWIPHGRAVFMRLVRAEAGVADQALIERSTGVVRTPFCGQKLAGSARAAAIAIGTWIARLLTFASVVGRRDIAEQEQNGHNPKKGRKTPAIAGK